MTKQIPKDTLFTVRSLVRNECANWDAEYSECFLIGKCEGGCPQLTSESLCCKYLINSVLPYYKELHARLTDPASVRTCEVCGGLFYPASNRAKYCRKCAAKVRKIKESERQKRNRGSSVRI